MSVYLGTNKIEPRAGLGSLSIVDTVDTNGGTIRSITNLPNSIDLSWLAASTPTPSVRNFFNTLINGNYEHGEFTLTSTPTNAFVTLFTMSSFSDQNPPQGIMIIDKDFYQGIDTSTLPNNGTTDAISLMWFDKSFLNPARELTIDSEYPSYGVLGWSMTQTYTAAGGGGTASSLAFDGSSLFARGYFLFDGNDLTWKSHFGGTTYTTFYVNRTYIWMVY